MRPFVIGLLTLVIALHQFEKKIPIFFACPKFFFLASVSF